MLQQQRLRMRMPLCPSVVRASLWVSFCVLGSLCVALLDGTLLCCVECVCVFSVACVSVFVIATVRSVCCAHRLNPTGGAQGAPTDELRACVYVGLCPGSF